MNIIGKLSSLSLLCLGIAGCQSNIGYSSTVDIADYLLGNILKLNIGDSGCLDNQCSNSNKSIKTTIAIQDALQESSRKVDILSQAKKFTVEIGKKSVIPGKDFAGKGSGVIIKKEGNQYYVLTNNHVVDVVGEYVALLRSERPGELGEKSKLEIVERFPEKDLALLTFNSQQDYTVAAVGANANQLLQGSEVYVFGWPVNDRRDSLQLAEGKITNTRIGEGYNFTYQISDSGDKVEPGMSGGAVLNQNGQLLGIHQGLTGQIGDDQGILITAISNFLPLPSINLLRTLTGHSKAICVEGCLAIASDGQTIYSGAMDGSVGRWNLATGQDEIISTNHYEPIWSIALSSDGQTLASGSWDKKVKLLNGSEDLTEHLHKVYSLAISPDGDLILSGSGNDEVGTIVGCRVRRDVCGPLGEHQSRVTSLAISADGKTLISAGDDGRIKAWDLVKGKLINQFRRYTRQVDNQFGVWSVAIAPDGNTVITGNADGTMRVCYLSNFQCDRPQQIHQESVSSVAISGNGQILVTGSWDKTVKVWHFPSLSLIGTLREHSGKVNSVAISADGETIASGSHDTTIKVWQVNLPKSSPTPTSSTEPPEKPLLW